MGSYKTNYAAILGKVLGAETPEECTPYFPMIRHKAFKDEKGEWMKIYIQILDEISQKPALKIAIAEEVKEAYDHIKAGFGIQTIAYMISDVFLRPRLINYVEGLPDKYDDLTYEICKDALSSSFMRIGGDGAKALALYLPLLKKKALSKPEEYREELQQLTYQTCELIDSGAVPDFDGQDISSFLIDISKTLTENNPDMALDIASDARRILEREKTCPALSSTLEHIMSFVAYEIQKDGDPKSKDDFNHAFEAAAKHKLTIFMNKHVSTFTQYYDYLYAKKPEYALDSAIKRANMYEIDSKGRASFLDYAFKKFKLLEKQNIAYALDSFNHCFSAYGREKPVELSDTEKLTFIDSGIAACETAIENAAFKKALLGYKHAFDSLKLLKHPDMLRQQLCKSVGHIADHYEETNPALSREAYELLLTQETCPIVRKGALEKHESIISSDKDQCSDSIKKALDSRDKDPDLVKRAIENIPVVYERLIAESDPETASSHCNTLMKWSQENMAISALFDFTIKSIEKTFPRLLTTSVSLAEHFHEQHIGYEYNRIERAANNANIDGTPYLEKFKALDVALRKQLESALNPSCAKPVSPDSLRAKFEAANEKKGTRQKEKQSPENREQSSTKPVEQNTGFLGRILNLKLW